jgi:hypothetical protein
MPQERMMFGVDDVGTIYTIILTWLLHLLSMWHAAGFKPTKNVLGSINHTQERQKLDFGTKLEKGGVV